MGNTVASEGEDMCDRPRVGIGEISDKKKKHRSLRKRMMDKFKKTKVDLPQKEFKEDKPEMPQSPQDALKRRNYYKHLGIVQKGSTEEKRERFGTTKIVSTVDFPGLEKDYSEFKNKTTVESPNINENKEMKNKSLSYIAMEKGKAITSGNFDDFEYRGRLKSSKSSSDLIADTKNGIEKNGKKRERSSSPNFAGNFNTKGNRDSADDIGTNFTSMAGVKDDPLEEEKVEKIDDKDTEGFKINFVNKNIRKKFL